MALMDFFKRNVEEKAQVVLPVQTTTVGNRVVRPNLTNYKALVTEGLYKNAAVQGCISALSSTMNEAPLTIVNANGEPVPNHPLARVFGKPNAGMSQAMFWQYVTTYLHTGGNCYIHKVRNQMGVVVGLVPYHDGQFAAVPGEYDFISHYVYTVNGRDVQIPVADVIQLRWGIDPLNPIKGLSPIDLAGAKIQTENELDATIYSLMANGGVPSGVLQVPVGTSEAAKNQISEQWKDKYSGTSKGNIAVLSGDVSYERMAQSLAELQADGIYGQLESSICGVFRVHPVVAMTYAGLLSSTYSNMESAFREFTTLTRVPMWNMWEEQMSVGLSAELNGGYKLEFDTSNVAALSNDEQIQVQITAQFSANLITQNEARVALGYPERTEGDKLSSEITGPPTLFGASAEDGEPDANGNPLFGTKGDRLSLNEEKASSIWKRTDDASRRHADKYLEHVRKLIKDVTNAALGTTKASKKLDPDNVNVQAMVKKFMASTEAMRQTMIQELVDLALMDVTGADFNAVSSFFDEIQSEVNAEVQAKMTQATETMKAKVARIIDKNAGLSASEMAVALRKGMDEAYKGQADVIARTTARAQTTTAQTSTWNGLNERETDPKKKLYKVWISMRDGDVRDSHSDLDGEHVGVKEPFTIDGDEGMGPGLFGEPENSINCRCVLTTVRGSQL